MKDKSTSKIQTSSCRKTENSPVNGQCLTDNAVYRTEVEVESFSTMNYIGSTEDTLVKTYSNYSTAFGLIRYRNIWKNKRWTEHPTKYFSIKWKPRALENKEDRWGEDKYCATWADENARLRMNSTLQTWFHSPFYLSHVLWILPCTEQF